MITVKCTYSDGNTVTTSINGTLEDAQSYFLGSFVNIGHVVDNLQQCVKVELV